MTDSTELKMNVAALKRVDPYIKDILGTATHVALYTFNPDNNEWEKTDIEGALFVYSRNGEPYNSILIMNRLNTKNLVEPVTQGLELQLQEPFLLYRNSKCNIYGIWFYDKEECIKIATLLNKLAEDSEDSSRKSLTNSGAKGKKVAAASAVAAKSGDNVDIFSMLSKAQEDFNTNKNCKKESEAGSEGSMPAAPTAPMGLDVTSQSVMDFFAKAKVNTGHFKAGDQPSPSAHPVSETKPLLARLMSHPAAHTLEHIEKQQRSITPQPLQQSGGMGSLAHSASMPTPNSASRSTPASKSKKQQNSTKMTPQHDSVVSTLNSVSQELQRQTKSTGNSNGTMNFHRIQSPTNTTSGSKHGIFSIGGQPLTTAHDDSIGTATLPDAMSALPMSFANLGMDCKSTEGTPTRPIPASAPALIPPTMFSAPSPSEPTNRPLEPLTRNQLLQAFNYLLKNDPDFINKLHEAYVKSFSEILS